MADVLLGVDIGTSSTKGVITHADGTVVASAQRRHRTEHPRPGFVEHDPEGIWWKDFRDITAELLPQADGPVVGVSVSGIGATTLPADANGEPLRHAILYGIDTRAGAEIDECVERYGADTIVERPRRRHADLRHDAGHRRRGDRTDPEPEAQQRARGVPRDLHPDRSHGLTMAHTRGHLYRAMLEAVGYSARSILDAIGEAGVQMRRIVAVGGGTKGGLWTQIVSDITGLPQELSSGSLGACYGDALFAARAAGLVTDDTVWASAATTVEPTTTNREVYDRLYTIYGELYPATRSQAHALAALQAEEGLVPADP